MITEKSPTFNMGPITDNISINISILYDYVLELALYDHME